MSKIDKAIETINAQLQNAIAKEKETEGTHDTIIWHTLVNDYNTAISALKEIEQYKSIGTVEECKESVRFKKYFDELHGQGLEVANWHQNGETQPFDTFYESALECEGDDA